MDLDAHNPAHVAHHAVIDADLGVGGRRLVVISGIARPEWTIDSDETHRDECRLKLHVAAGNMEQVTVHTGLASIGNEDTEYVFATDSSKVVVDAAGELVLHTQLAVMGEKSSLYRFGYQIVLTTRVVVSEISGTITWQTAWLRPASATPSAVAGNLQITANTRTVTTGGGPFGGEIEHLTPVRPGEVVSVEVGEQVCQARYRITDPPKGQQLKVTVEQAGMQGGPGSSILIGTPVPNGDLVTVSVADPTRGGVDFEAIRLVVT